MKVCANCSIFDPILKCESITPFGSPVLPLEKMIVARSSSFAAFCCPSALVSHRAGNKTAISSATIFSLARGFSASSSSRIALAGTSSFTRSRNAFDVTTVSNSHCRAHAASVSFDAV